MSVTEPTAEQVAQAAAAILSPEQRKAIEDLMAAKVDEERQKFNEQRAAMQVEAARMQAEYTEILKNQQLREQAMAKDVERLEAMAKGLPVSSTYHRSQNQSKKSPNKSLRLKTTKNRE